MQCAYKLDLLGYYDGVVFHRCVMICSRFGIVVLSALALAAYSQSSTQLLGANG